MHTRNNSLSLSGIFQSKLKQSKDKHTSSKFKILFDSTQTTCLWQWILFQMLSRTPSYHYKRWGDIIKVRSASRKTWKSLDNFITRNCCLQISVLLPSLYLYFCLSLSLSLEFPQRYLHNPRKISKYIYCLSAF